MRREVIRQGALDAVYKFKTAASGTCWIKDQATIEAYEPEGVYVSLGNSTIATKEMKVEERLKETQKSLQKSEKNISTSPDDADNLTDPLARADQAMFSVKEGGKDSICGISREEGDPPVSNCR